MKLNTPSHQRTSTRFMRAGWKTKQPAAATPGLRSNPELCPFTAEMLCFGPARRRYRDLETALIALSEPAIATIAMAASKLPLAWALFFDGWL
ncbi:hypothetical protein [Collimonas pratensis]|uniref:hypothetical protein n=1 Tax=Collimonas pratensis TaxID=279113 RepID=UPI0012E8A5F8|nr:hypothetical protein [Collimonas pratensis]